MYMYVISMYVYNTHVCVTRVLCDDVLFPPSADNETKPLVHLTFSSPSRVCV